MVITKYDGVSFKLPCIIDTMILEHGAWIDVIQIKGENLKGDITVNNINYRVIKKLKQSKLNTELNVDKTNIVKARYFLENQIPAIAPEIPARTLPGSV